jgi:hypothetical protein
MLDVFHIPQAFGPNADVQIFNVPSTVSNLEWHTWLKPRGKSMVYMLAMGGGAGGGGGFTAAAGNARGGGGGGGSSAVISLVCPTFLLPDRLFIQVGAGGQGVSSGGGTAGSGVNSFIAFAPDNTGINLVVQACSVVPTGGGTGTGAAVGAAGVAGTVPAGFVVFGPFLGTAGAAGAAGGAVAGAAGVSVSFIGLGKPMGAPGGGGTTSADFAGGGITGVANSLVSDFRPQPAAAGSNDGSGGFLLGPPSAPWWSYCGLGGGSSNAGVGGNGGNGGPGAGGGGGGGGTTGGRGGNGGNGLVIIACW